MKTLRQRREHPRRTLATFVAALAASTPLLLGTPAQAAPIPLPGPAVGFDVADARPADARPADGDLGEIPANSRKNCGEKPCRTAWELLDDNWFKK
ncbi:hypothetical protein ACFYVL_20245 [Streptomyces sp. NPDC004111]|uniref:hypothetical protein n=1 Tax=Streptomyces sp. NPDC004111 TaxID=3364690 RepID=UPI003692047A